MALTVTYRGVRFRSYPGSPYYGPGIADRQRGIESLHREVWKHERGPIPAGHEVHHVYRDDYATVDPDRLECLTPAEHAERHADDRRQLGRSPEFLAHLARIRPLSAAWHGSPEGLAWHAEHGRQTWVDRPVKHAVCDHCGQPYEHFTAARFCSPRCKAAARRASGVDNEQRRCAVCSRRFMVNRFSKSECCSRTCGARLRRSRAASVEPGC